MFTKKNSVLTLVALTTTVVHANFFSDIDNHFKHLWSTLDSEISAATKTSSLSINSTYDAEKNAVVVKIAVPGLTEKDIAFNLENNRLVLEAKSDTHESLVILTEKTILVEQTEYEELTNKSGKAYTFITGHNRVVNSLPHTVILQEAQAEYENGVLTVILPSATKKIAIPITHKTSAPAPEVKPETKKIIINSKKNKTVEQPVEKEKK